MNRRVLFVDDESAILNAVKRIFIDEDVVVMTAESADEGLAIIREEPVAVIVSDNRMPAVSGIEFLEQAKRICPESIRILLTGYVDVQSAIDAINMGEVYRFVTKPWNDDVLKQTVLDAVGRFHVVTAMRGANDATLRSLAQTIELKDPYTRGHCDRVAQYAVSTAERLGMPAEVLLHIRYGSWLHDCGKIGVPEAILNNRGPLTPEQMEVVRNHSRWGAEVARLANLPDPVVQIILCHHEKYDGSGYPRGLRGEGIPLEARVVTIADLFDAMTTDRPYREARPWDEAVSILSGAGGTHVDPEVLRVFLDVLRDRRACVDGERGA